MIKLEKNMLQSGHLIYGGNKGENPQHIKENFNDGDFIKVVEKTGRYYILHKL